MRIKDHDSFNQKIKEQLQKLNRSYSEENKRFKIFSGLGVANVGIGVINIHTITSILRDASTNDVHVNFWAMFVLGSAVVANGIQGGIIVKYINSAMKKLNEIALLGMNVKEVEKSINMFSLASNKSEDLKDFSAIKDHEKGWRPIKRI